VANDSIDVFAEYAAQLPPFKAKGYRDINCIVCNALNAVVEDLIDQGRCRCCWHPLPPNLHLKDTK
jgi:hypothetical protein